MRLPRHISRTCVVFAPPHNVSTAKTDERPLSTSSTPSRTARSARSTSSWDSAAGSPTASTSLSAMPNCAALVSWSVQEAPKMHRSSCSSAARRTLPAAPKPSPRSQTTATWTSCPRATASSWPALVQTRLPNGAATTATDSAHSPSSPASPRLASSEKCQRRLTALSASWLARLRRWDTSRREPTCRVFLHPLFPPKPPSPVSRHRHGGSRCSSAPALPPCTRRLRRAGICPRPHALHSTL
mmetsp:Transcript_68631/g.161372  ORF Transcript_68631/g.161372 Transcript_68631/m.161372 type:complete len:242 (+) Transcript_68631:412-1137(+)